MQHLVEPSNQHELILMQNRYAQVSTRFHHAKFQMLISFHCVWNAELHFKNRVVCISQKHWEWIRYGCKWNTTAIRVCIHWNWHLHLLATCPINECHRLLTKCNYVHFTLSMYLKIVLKLKFTFQSFMHASLRWNAVEKTVSVEKWKINKKCVQTFYAWSFF